MSRSTFFWGPDGLRADVGRRAARVTLEIFGHEAERGVAGIDRRAVGAELEQVALLDQLRIDPPQLAAALLRARLAIHDVVDVADVDGRGRLADQRTRALQEIVGDGAVDRRERMASADRDPAIADDRVVQHL